MKKTENNPNPNKVNSEKSLCTECYVFNLLQERIAAHNKLILDLQNAGFRSLKDIDNIYLN